MLYNPSLTVKLIIWDLDHTFWVNTLDEEEIIPIEEHLSLVRRLNDHGVMNSICSKNDFDKAKSKLQELGIWDEFTLPAIAWNSKGSMIASIIDSFSLRAENVLFIDDNEMNLREAEYYNPTIQTLNCTVDSIACILEQILEKSKPDNRKRFKQYKVLEKKVADKTAFSDNTKFLRQSGVMISFSDDCASHIDRIEELVNRTNQLNFTKLRMQKEELISMTADNANKSFVLFVKDNYGDYGLAGFVCLVKESNRLLHFVFSCRIMNMGVENYVWSMLGYPECEVVGDVSAVLTKDEVPDWIKITTRIDADAEKSGSKKILLIGGCDLSQMHHYLSGDNIIETYFNFPSLRYHSELHRDGINFLHASRYATEDVKKLILDEFPLSHPDFFNLPDLTSYDTIIYSPLIDYVQSEYYPIWNSSITISYGDFLDAGSEMDSTRKELLERGVELERVERFCSGWRTDGAISKQSFLLKLDALFRGFQGKLIILTGAEKIYPSYHRQMVTRHIEMNSLIRSFAYERGNSTVIEIDDFLEGELSFTNSIRHYSREVYFKLARAIDAELQQVETINTVVSKSVLHLAIVPLDGERNYKYRYFYVMTDSETPLLQPTPFGEKEDTVSVINRLQEAGFKQVDSRQRRVLRGHTYLFNKLQQLTIHDIPFPKIISYDKVSLLPYVSTATYSSKVTEVMEIAEYLSTLVTSSMPVKTVIYGNPEEHQIEGLLLIGNRYQLEMISCMMHWGTAPEVDNVVEENAVQSGNRIAIQEYCRQFRGKVDRAGKPLVLFISYPSAVSFLTDGTMSDRFYDVYRDYFLERGFHVLRIELPYYFQITGDKKEYFHQTQHAIRSGYETILFDDFTVEHVNTHGSLNEKYQIFSQSVEFHNVMRHNGVSLFTPLKNYWNYIFVDYLPACIDMLHISRKLLQELQPVYFFASYEVGDYARSLIVEAHRAGICSFGTQHGFIFPEHEYYMENNQNNCADLNAGFYGYLSPTLTLLYGDLHKEILTKIGSYSQDSVAVMGDWRVIGKTSVQSPDDSKKLKEGYFPGNPKRVALLLTSGLSSGIINDMIRVLTPMEFSILIKMHPNEINEDRITAPFTDAGFMVRAVRDNLYGCIAIADLIFTSAYSSVVPECLALGKIPLCKDDFDAGFTLPWKNIVFDIDDYPDMYQKEIQYRLNTARELLPTWGMEPNYNYSIFCSRLRNALIKADSFYRREPTKAIMEEKREYGTLLLSKNLSIIILMRGQDNCNQINLNIIKKLMEYGCSVALLYESGDESSNNTHQYGDATVHTVKPNENMIHALNQIINISNGSRILLLELDALSQIKGELLVELLHDKNEEIKMLEGKELLRQHIMQTPLISYSGIEIHKQPEGFSEFDEAMYAVAPWELLIRKTSKNGVKYHQSLSRIKTNPIDPITTSLGIVKTVNRHFDSFLGDIGKEATTRILLHALKLVEGISGDDAAILRSTISTFMENLVPPEQLHTGKVY